MVLLGTVHVHHGKLSARICCNLHQIMSLIYRWHTDTHTHIIRHLLFIKLSEFSPPHNAGSNSAKCVGKLMVTNTLRSNQARIFSPAPTNGAIKTDLCELFDTNAYEATIKFCIISLYQP